MKLMLSLWCFNGSVYSLHGSVVENENTSPCMIALIEHQEDHGYRLLYRVLYVFFVY